MSAVSYRMYASRITFSSAFHRKIFLEIQQQAIKNNKSSGITGFLCFKDGKFLQYFEGEDAVCENLWQVLGNDKRHKDIVLMSAGTTANKRFKDWAMHCFKLDEEAYDIEHQFLDFDIFNWKDEEVHKAINSVSNYRFNKHAIIPKSSYMNLLMSKFFDQHKVFIFLQVLLLILAVLLFLFLSIIN